MFLFVWLFMVFVLIFMVGLLMNAALVLLLKVLPFVVIGVGIWIVYRVVRRTIR